MTPLGFVDRAGSLPRSPRRLHAHTGRKQNMQSVRTFAAGYAKTPTRGNELHLADADAITDSNHALAEHVRHSSATG
jgi:hypothetical protein